jgi:DNA-binding MarR family transcriptional regulator
MTNEKSYIKHMTEIFTDEIRGNILFVLDMFGSQNLQTLHELLKKPKSTILGHIKEMVEIGQIELDSKATAEKTGKFYQLSQEIHELFNRLDDNVRLQKDTLKKEKISKGELAISLSNLIRTVGFQANLIASLAGQYLEENADLFENPIDHKEDLAGFFAGIYELNLQSFDEVKEIYEIQQDYDKKLKKFDKNLPDRKKAKYRMLFFMLGASKDKIDPRNKDN